MFFLGCRADGACCHGGVAREGAPTGTRDGGKAAEILELGRGDEGRAVHGHQGQAACCIITHKMKQTRHPGCITVMLTLLASYIRAQYIVQYMYIPYHALI